MPRRHDDLFDGIASFRALHAAAKRAVTGKRRKPAAAAFMAAGERAFAAGAGASGGALPERPSPGRAVHRRLLPGRRHLTRPGRPFPLLLRRQDRQLSPQGERRPRHLPAPPDRARGTTAASLTGQAAGRPSPSAPTALPLTSRSKARNSGPGAMHMVRYVSRNGSHVTDTGYLARPVCAGVAPCYASDRRI